MAEINKQMDDIGISPVVPWEDETEEETQSRAKKEFFTEQPYEDTDVKPLSLKEKWKKAQEKKLELLYGSDKEGITGFKRIKEVWKAPIDMPGNGYNWNEETKDVEDREVLELQSPIREGYYNLYYGNQTSRGLNE